MPSLLPAMKSPPTPPPQSIAPRLGHRKVGGHRRRKEWALPLAVLARQVLQGGSLSRQPPGDQPQESKQERVYFCSKESEPHPARVPSWSSLRVPCRAGQCLSPGLSLSLEPCPCALPPTRLFLARPGAFSPQGWAQAGASYALVGQGKQAGEWVGGWGTLWLSVSCGRLWGRSLESSFFSSLKAAGQQARDTAHCPALDLRGPHLLPSFPPQCAYCPQHRANVADGSGVGDTAQGGCEGWGGALRTPSFHSAQDRTQS